MELGREAEEEIVEMVQSKGDIAEWQDRAMGWVGRVFMGRKHCDCGNIRRSEGE